MNKPFLSWLTKNKLKATDKWVPDLRCVTDTSTFRYLSNTGYSSDQVVERAVEDGWFFVNEDQPPELTFQDILNKVEHVIVKNLLINFTFSNTKFLNNIYSFN